MAASQMMMAEHGIAAKIKRVIMEQDTYHKAWGLGPVAQEKQRLIKEGKLTEKGKPNSKTPPNWLRNFLEKKVSQ